MSKEFKGSINDQVVGKLDKMKTKPSMFSGVGEGICVGRDSAEPVCSDYATPFTFRGETIKQVTTDISGEPYHDVEKSVAAAFARD